ncbi:MAG: anthranilate synthase component I [Anaerolineae bacterium]|nr:anthranilate synthase component I [Gloeobacterales cyanobacterium ES-bin-313]
MANAVPNWLELPLQSLSGAEVFARLFADEPIAVLLESPLLAAKTARYSILAACPSRVLAPEIGEVFSTLKQWLSQAQTESYPEALRDLPFRGGLLGWLGYDLAWEIERLPWQKQDELPFPVAYWFEPGIWAVADHEADRLWLVQEEPMGFLNWDVWLERLKTPPRSTSTAFIAGDPVLKPEKEDFLAAVQQIQTHIRAGDIFQGNLSLRFALDWQGEGWSLYQTLTALNPSPFASYWRTPYGEMISCSPERLVEVRGRSVSTRPIAGTRPRGTDKAGDSALEAELLLSAKECAEHIMLVDLERNDLGRVCKPGSVQVDELLGIERYSHVMHIVSNVIGELRADCDALDLVRAVFPGGTITGCPKVRCMEIIEKLEPVRRSLFYGSCGYLDRTGDLDLNILIRTLLKTERSVWGQVGAGIVADSDPASEWSESLQKAQAQWNALFLGSQR